MEIARFSPEDSQLVSDLHRISSASPKLIKSSTYLAPSDTSITVRSWKMNEFKYYDVPSPFPTLARGLFTVNLPSEGDDTPKYRIVARGYDKFFNIDEVPWTSWRSLENRTCAPYILSLKSNGCIIFIAALTPSKLLITSKHSIGHVAGSSLSHAQAGEQWIRKYLAEKNKTEKDLASTLWENNWTAIAELCDDSFEEHVLAYPPEKTGLHLHGLNESTKAFKTLPQAAVDAFADQWGFIKTSSLTMNSIAEVKSFTDKIGETGKWNDEAVEGFVVRTHVVEPKIVDYQDTHRGKKSSGASPYSAGSTLFFKVKFDEPYMMYRDWREITKMLLSSKGPLDHSRISAARMKRPETRLYVKWVTKEIQKDRKPFDEYMKGKGIISTREKFLKWLASGEGKGTLENSKTENLDKKVFGKTIIVPVAVPGSGKTAISVALAYIFDFGHTQSDDVHVKKAAPVFVKNVTKLLKDHDVVIADKNNHLRQHRQALREATSKLSPPVRLLALNWSTENLPPSTIHRICGDRVAHRGENHQTLRADSSDKFHEDVIWRFIQSTESLAESEVDACVDMDLSESLEQSVDRAIEGCVRVLGLPTPSREKISEALEAVKKYAVTAKKKQEKEKRPTPRYFGLLPEVDLEEVIGARLELADVPEGSKAFWTHLKSNAMVQKRPHVTIVHQNSLPKESELWDRCSRLNLLVAPPRFKIKLGTIIWNERIMAVTVDGLEVDNESQDLGQDAHEFVLMLPSVLMDRLHITVGTRGSNVQAVESIALVQSWRSGTTESGVQTVDLDQVVCGRLKGLFG